MWEILWKLPLALYHRQRASSLERQGKYREAACHLYISFQGDTREWHKLRAVADLYRRAGLLRDAVQYLHKAIEEDASGEGGYFIVREIVAYLEQLPDYAGALEIYFTHPRLLVHSPDGVYRQYKEYRSRDVSFRLSRPRLLEMYVNLYIPSARTVRTISFETLPPSMRVDAVEEIVTEGLADEVCVAVEVFGVRWPLLREHEYADERIRSLNDARIQSQIQHIAMETDRRRRRLDD